MSICGYFLLHASGKTRSTLLRDPLDASGIIGTVPRCCMSARLPSHSSFGFLHRWLAAGGAALVLALTIFAASPSAHGLLHDADHSVAIGDDGCAVVMFASGVSLPVAPLFITPPASVPQGISPVTAAEVFLVAPRYLRQPERGPPSSWVS